MDFIVDTEGGDRLVRLSGTLSFRNQKAVEAALDRLFAKAAGRYVIDLSEVDGLDSVGLGLLIVAKTTAKERAAALVLRAPAPPVSHTLTPAKSHEVFTVED
jgi:anti-anti-sigma factor